MKVKKYKRVYRKLIKGYNRGVYKVKPHYRRVRKNVKSYHRYSQKIKNLPKIGNKIKIIPKKLIKKAIKGTVIENISKELKNVFKTPKSILGKISKIKNITENPQRVFTSVLKSLLKGGVNKLDVFSRLEGAKRIIIDDFVQKSKNSEELYEDNFYRDYAYKKGDKKKSYEKYIRDNLVERFQNKIGGIVGSKEELIKTTEKFVKEMLSALLFEV